MLGDPSVMLIRASIPLMDGFDQRLMRFVVKTLIGSELFLLMDHHGRHAQRGDHTEDRNRKNWHRDRCERQQPDDQPERKEDQR